MKTLDDWLASSGSESDKATEPSSTAESGLPSTARSSQGPPFSPTGFSSGAGSAAAALAASPTGSTTSAMTGLRSGAPMPVARTGRLEETRAKMERLLGQDAVNRALSPSSLDGLQASPTTRAVPAPPARDTVAQPATVSGAAGAAASPTAPKAVGSPVVTAAPAPEPAPAPPQSPPYVPVEVMVVDRGTQTVTTVGVQTDPEPPVAAVPPGVGYCPGCRSAMPAYAMGLGFAPAGRTVPYSVDSRPYRQQLRELERTQMRDASALREQLQAVQDSIDTLIARYNLPPPPR